MRNKEMNEHEKINYVDFPDFLFQVVAASTLLIPMAMNMRCGQIYCENGEAKFWLEPEI